MANGLGDIASLLGQSYVESARQRDDDYDKYRRKAQRQQLLTMFAAPIAKGIGEGVVDLAGDLFLGDNSKDFFSTREGAAFQSRLSNVQKPLEGLKEQKDLLLKASKGQGAVQGYLNILEEQKRQRFKDEFGTADNYETLIGAATFSPTEQDIAEANKQVEELDSLINDLSAATDLNNKELLARYKQTDLGKGRGRRITGRIAAFLRGKDYNEAIVEPSIDYLLTKGDISLRDTEFYRLMQDENGTFKKDLKTLVETATDIGLSTSDQFDNMFEEFKLNNPDVARVLTEDIERKRELATERGIVLGLARNNSQVENVISELDKSNIPVTVQNVKAGLLDKVNGFDKEEEFARSFFTNEANKDIIANIRNGITQRTYGFDTWEEITSVKNQNAVDEEVLAYLTQSVTAFNNDLISVTTDLKDNKEFDIASSIVRPGGVRVLANKYLRAMLDPNGNHLVTEEFDIPKRSWYQGFGKNKADIMSGTIRNQDGLRQLIVDNLTNIEQVRENERTANKTGESLKGNKDKRVRQGLESPPQFNIRAVEDIAEDIKTNLTMTDAQKEKEFERLFQGFEPFYEDNPSIAPLINQLRSKYLSVDPYREAQLMRSQIRRSD